LIDIVEAKVPPLPVKLCPLEEALDFRSIDLQSGAPVLAVCVALLVALAIFRALLSRKPGRKPAAKRTRKSIAALFVYVEDDGTARELEDFEIDYLSEDFHGADGNRPYIKSSYRALTPDGRISGYLRRRDLPRGMRVKSALEGVVPVRTADQAIAIAKAWIADRARFLGTRSVDVEALGAFRAERDGKIWLVTRTPAENPEERPPPLGVAGLPCIVRLSAASGRVVSYDNWPRSVRRS
jgi:hypothetical protein